MPVDPPTSPEVTAADASVASADGSPVLVEDVHVAPAPTSETRVLAVLVVHDGEPWLPRSLAALGAQTHPHLDVVAVDNGSTDGSRRVLQRALGADRVLIADRDLGFGAAVSMALDARAGDDAPYVILVHDDLELAPTAVAALAHALDGDPRLAIVGPKLRAWDHDRQLQSLGWTVDLTGRADSGIDEGELDQGQRDVDDRALYVSTAGMLVRRVAFDEVGRFDRRYHLFRDDLDLCWRAWLTGWDVEVVPSATAGHVAAAATYQRLGQTRFIGPRYFAERNTLATLLKNYGMARLALVVPAFFLVGIAKVLGFLLTRRFSDAWQTVRAWLWNGLHLLETRRLRVEVQRVRTRSDGEVRELFGRIAPRIRAYAEAIGEWVAGGDGAAVETRSVVGPPPEPTTATARAIEAVRARPVLVVGATLVVLLVASSVTILAPGQLRGGQLAPWPVDPTVFFADHGAAWHTATGLGTAATPSPAQGLLGVLQTLLLGSAYLASRTLLLGSILVAWVLALRATQRFSARKLPRVVAATAYVLSPPALAASTSGQVGGLVALAALPGLVAAAGTYARRSTPPTRAWRAAAGAALLGAIVGSFVPVVLPVLLGAGLVLLLSALPRAPRSWRGPLAARVGLATLGPWVLTAPWSLQLLSADGPLRAAALAEPVDSELWRWVLLVPDVAGAPGPLAGIGFLLAGILGVLFGWRRQPDLVASLWTVALGAAFVGWFVARTGAPYWPALPLLVSAAAYAGLLAVAFARGEHVLARHAFGWRQVIAAATIVGVMVSLGTVATELLRGPQGNYLRDVSALPQFITAAAADGDPFSVLVLADVEGTVRYEVVPGGGPTMAATGVPDDPRASAQVDRAVADVLTGRDVRAAAALGRLGIRFLVVPDGGVSDRLDLAVRGQVGLEPRPVSEGRVLAVEDALPAASLVAPEVAASLRDTGVLPRDAQVQAITTAADGIVTFSPDRDGVLLLAQADATGWEVAVDGEVRDPVAGSVPAFEVDADARVEVTHQGQAARTATLVGQVVGVLLVISLALRPPGFARRRMAATAARSPDAGSPTPASEEVAP